MLIFSAGKTQSRNRKNASVRKENGILLHPTSRGRNIPGPGKEWVKNPKQCDCDILCIFSLLYSKAQRLHNSAKIISVVQLLLMKFRLLNKLKVERMSGEKLSLKGMPATATDAIPSKRDTKCGLKISECEALFVNKYLRQGQSFLVIICEKQIP